jgi:hypothetical protein
MRGKLLDDSNALSSQMQLMMTGEFCWNSTRSFNAKKGGYLHDTSKFVVNVKVP